MRLVSSIAALAFTLPAAAQVPSLGDPIRVTSAHYQFQAEPGTFVSQTNDSLTFILAGGHAGALTIAKYEIDAIDVNYARSTQGHALTGAAIGGIIGGLIGLRAAWSNNQLDCGDTGSGCGSRVSVPGAGLLGAAAGGGIGALIGLAIRSPMFTAADPRTLSPQPKRVSVVPLWDPSTRSFGVAVRAGF